MNRANRLGRWALYLLSALTVTTSMAQGFPSKPVTLVVPYPAGGASDFVARKVQPDAAKDLGQPVTVDNVGGAGGTIGLSKMLAAPADGHTVAIGSPMELILAPMAIQGVKMKSEDFRLVAQLVSTNTILVVRNTLEAKTVDELVALAKKSADKPLSYGSVGNGSLYHLIGEKFGQLTSTKLTHVPYRGIAPLMNDLMGGQIDMAFLPMAGPVMPTIAEGKFRALGITAKAPHPLFKQYPAMAAMPGLSAMEFDLWAGVQVAKATPDDVVARLNKAFYASLQNPEVRKALEATGNTVMSPRSPASLATLYQQEIERYRAIANSINLQAQPAQ